MCKFFSIVTLKGKFYYFNWQQRQARNFENCDSHSEIVKFYDLKDDAINCYEYNPLTKHLEIDCQHGKDDSKEVKAWCDNLDWKTIVEPLVIKDTANPFELPKVEKPTDEQIEWLKQWDSVWNLVRNSVWDSVWYSAWASVKVSVGNLVGNFVWDSVWDSVGNLVWEPVGPSILNLVGNSVWDSVRCYVSSFFDIEYKYDLTSCVKLWESGLVPSYDGTTWRLHSGKDADIVYEWKPK